MLISVDAYEQQGELLVHLTLQLKGATELAWGLGHCHPHRCVRSAVSKDAFPQWQEHHAQGEIDACLALCLPVVLLWGQPCLEPVEVEDDGATLEYRNRLQDGWIARALVERLLQAETLEQLERDLMMLELEAGGVGFKTAVADSGDPVDSLFDMRRDDAEACPPVAALPPAFAVGPPH